MNIKSAVLTAALISAGLAASATQAATSTATMPVTITIQNACNVSSVAPTTLNFGTQGPLVAVVNQTSTITVTCTTGATYNIGLDAGSNPSTPGDVNTRRMALSGKYVLYQLYSDSGRTVVWGNTIGTNTVASTGTGAAQTFAVNGQVPVQTTPPAGVYNDTVNVTVTY